MKLKGVNPIAQHIEKAVLGITAIALLLVISMQFVTDPNQVKVGTGSRTVSPDQIYTELASKANALQSQISDQSPALPDIQPVDLVARYEAAFKSSDTAQTNLTAPLGDGVDVAQVLGTKIEIENQNVGTIEAIMVPESSKPLAHSSWATLDPYAVLEIPQYADFIPAAQPFDFPSVSIEVDFSGTALRDVLEGNHGFAGVPRLFWVTTGMAVMGLDVERQHLMSDGTWSTPESITAPPSTPLPTNAVNSNDGLVRLNEIVASAQSVADEVMRPMFPPTISGPEWIPPSEAQGTSNSKLTPTQRLQRQLARLTTEVDRLNNPSTRQTPTRQTSTSRSGGGAGKSGTRNTRDPGSSGRSNTTQSQKKIERLEKQIQEITEDLDRLGVDTSDAQPENTDILDQELIQLWAHDIGIEPGKTYRYRTRVILNNPYFRKGAYLDEADQAQQALTVEPFASGNWSDWSDPVDVGAKEFFFVTEAAQPIVGEQLPQARVELYTMYYGYYRRSSENLSPGEPLLGNMRISSDLILIDTTTVDASAAATYIEAVNTDQPDLEVPQGLTPAPDRLSIDLGTYLIQISTDPLETNPDQADSQAGSPAGYRLIFRNANGTILYRSPSIDRNSAVYQQAQSSSSSAARSKLRPTGQPAASPAVELFTVVKP